MISDPYKNLGCGVANELVKWFCEKRTTKERKQTILKDLRSDFMVAFSDGRSLEAAEQLEKNPEEVAARLKKLKKEGLI